MTPSPSDLTDGQILVGLIILIGFFAALGGFVVALNLVIIDIRERLARRRRSITRVSR